ncbi:hypothetical protein, conserved [Trypanosoma brucei gambiense DAL972]|uniref:Uncharacterized protein n=1 Tax=Trypanosoma brucei gambiense (strain MHOM/CI/86/DAL972) TaxID=679716 RepID=C9ZWY3_TRYB9|nr:hypothetical protein, conserved [Trypanosoma brucei gambiense DAL972]CBH13922.1 hypothetical protein, conserved [Trypanosoma brucei gambiense DAL972]|eukprot:XP_011776198.1 hypothetical protein, conserved [Trypanosoma brucei gambiense DAL972]
MNVLSDIAHSDSSFGSPTERGEIAQRKPADGKRGNDRLTIMKDSIRARSRFHAAGNLRAAKLADDDSSYGTKCKGTQADGNRSGRGTPLLNNAFFNLCPFYEKEASDGAELQEQSKHEAAIARNDLAEGDAAFDVQSLNSLSDMLNNDAKEDYNRVCTVRRHHHVEPHFGLLPQRSHRLSTVSIGKSSRDEKLQAHPERVVDCRFLPMEEKSRNWLQSCSAKEACNSVTLLVNRAVDNFVLKEASISFAETASSHSILSLDDELVFHNPLTFPVFSEPGESDDQSEALMRSNFVALLPTFESQKASSCMSGSAFLQINGELLTPDASNAVELAPETSPAIPKKHQRPPLSVEGEGMELSLQVAPSTSLHSNGADELNANNSWSSSANCTSSLLDSLAALPLEWSLAVIQLVYREELTRNALVSAEHGTRACMISLK